MSFVDDAGIDFNDGRLPRVRRLASGVGRDRRIHGEPAHGRREPPASRRPAYRRGRRPACSRAARDRAHRRRPGAPARLRACTSCGARSRCASRRSRAGSRSATTRSCPRGSGPSSRSRTTEPWRSCSKRRAGPCAWTGARATRPSPARGPATCLSAHLFRSEQRLRPAPDQEYGRSEGPSERERSVKRTKLVLPISCVWVMTAVAWAQQRELRPERARPQSGRASRRGSFPVVGQLPGHAGRYRRRRGPRRARRPLVLHGRGVRSGLGPRERTSRDRTPRSPWSRRWSWRRSRRGSRPRVRVGDLLTTSPTAGHAMRARDALPGTVFGKALESLDVGTGLVRMLVMLL